MIAGAAASFRPTPDGNEIVANGRVVRLPDGTRLLPAAAGLAAAIVDEWNAHRPATLPPTDWRPFVLTRLQATLQHLRAGGRGQASDHLVEAADSEPLCYRDPVRAGPDGGPGLHPPTLLEWAGATLGEAFATRAGIMPFAQPVALHAALRTHLAALSDAALTGAVAVQELTGSVVLALAFVHRQVDPRTAAAATLAEEAAGWSRIADSTPLEAAERALAAELGQVGRFLAQSEPSPDVSRERESDLNNAGRSAPTHDIVKAQDIRATGSETVRPGRAGIA